MGFEPWRKVLLLTANEYEDIKELGRKYKPQTIETRRALTTEELRRLEEYLKKISYPAQTLVFLLGTQAGLRVEEMINLKVEDVFLEPVSRPPYLFIQGKGAEKGKKEREVIILPHLENYLRFYLKYREALDPLDDTLLITERRRKASIRTIQYWVKNWSKKLGIPGLTPHMDTFLKNIFHFFFRKHNPFPCPTNNHGNRVSNVQFIIHHNQTTLN